jgi:hypothetical protein
MTMRVQAVLTLMVAVAMLGLASCGHYNCASGANFGSSTCTSSGGGLGGGGNGNGSGTVFAYLLGRAGTSTTMVADSLDLGTNTFQEDTTFVSPVFTTTFPANGGTVVVSKGSQKYLYIPFSDGTLWGFAVDGATGALTAVSSNPSSASGGNSIASDPAGNFLFVGDSATNVISAFTIAADGSLALVPGSPFPSQISAAQMTTDGKGQFLYVTLGPPLGGTQGAVFGIQANGALSAGTAVNLVFPVTKLLGENTGAYLLGVNGQTAHLYVFAINSTTGGLTAPTTPFVTAAVPADLVVHPSGKFVYTFDGPTTSMEGYQIGTGGTLTAVLGSPFTGIDLDQGQFDQTGLFLFGVGSGAGATFGPYDVSSTGDISVSTFPLLGFLGGDFAVTDSNNAP